MLEAPIPADEEKRLALLRACNILYTPAERAFDDVAQLAADLCGTEIALITLVDADYQWFKARVGVEQTGVARDMSFCGHCIAAGSPLIVPDTHVDPRFADNPLVTGNPGIRFYAGVPLQVEEGSAIGALSVADRRPRTLTPRQLESLRRLAEQIARELRLRRDLERVSSTLPPADWTMGPGLVIADRWHITRELGRGGAGAVFEALDANGERAAIKVLLPEWRSNAEVLERFAREARVLMRLTTPHVGKLLDVGNLELAQGGLPFLVLEYLEGTDLGRLVESEGPVPFRRAFGWCADACEGVAEAHELGVVHRDLKPSNVFLARTPQDPALVKVLDFGIAAGDPAAASPAKLTSTRAVVGSPAYMSPEQMMAASEVGPQSDIWSMGVLLYELVTGKIPFPGATALEIFAAVMTHPPTPPREHLRQGLPGSVEAVLLKCLQKESTDRFPSMAALARTLRAIAT